MANMPDVRKKHYNLGLNVELYAKVRRYAKHLGITVTDVIREVLERVFSCHELNAEDKAWIDAEVKQNIKRRKNGGRTKSGKKAGA